MPASDHRSCSEYRSQLHPQCRLINVAPVTSLFNQILQGSGTENVGDGSFHAGGHAIETAADVDHGAIGDPCAQHIGGLAQLVLNVNPFGLIAREGQIETLQHAVALPLFDFALVMEVMAAL